LVKIILWGQGIWFLGTVCSLLSCDYRKTSIFSACHFRFCKMGATPFKKNKSWQILRRPDIPVSISAKRDHRWGCVEAFEGLAE